ncbi:MAG: ATP-binding cassette domain-containing protein [Ruminococcaceae bacterium]|jgi:cell division transport system ATP-binding protein|nr:ATP-binding cassette domain-containing protein [Oscillospiraceae bacterium]
MPVIRLEHIGKIYKNSKRGVSGTLELDLTIRQGEFVFVTGERGCGKSTLMELVAGEQEPDRGSIWLGGADLGRFSRRACAELRRCMGIVLADSELKRTETLFKNLASEKYLEYLRDSIFNRPKIEKALSLVGLPGKADRRASELTASEACRALLARAIWRSPSILVLDGLTERADDDTVWDMLHLLTALNDRGTTVILATDGSYGDMLCKRVITLSEGKVASDIHRG